LIDWGGLLLWRATATVIRIYTLLLWLRVADRRSAFESQIPDDQSSRFFQNNSYMPTFGCDSEMKFVSND